MEQVAGIYDELYGQDLGKSTSKGALMDRIWGEWLNSNSKGAINYKRLPNKQHLVICKFSCRAPRVF